MSISCSLSLVLLDRVRPDRYPLGKPVAIPVRLAPLPKKADAQTLSLITAFAAVTLPVSVIAVPVILVAASIDVARLTPVKLVVVIPPVVMLVAVRLVNVF